jgi:hypothetical protein
MYIHIGEIIELARVEAIAFKLHPTPASMWRNLCREYSKKFHTELNEVLEMSPEFVIGQVMEERLDDVNVSDPDRLEELMERIYLAEDPNYESHKEKDLQSWIKDVEEEETERLAKDAPVRTKKSRYPSKQEAKPEIPKDLPKDGFVNFDYINKNEES